MEIKIQGDVKGNIIENVEPGNTILGYYGSSVALDMNNYTQMKALTQELQDLKETFIKMHGKENACDKIDESVDAIKEKDRSKLLRALNCLGRECVNIAEGVLGSMLATFFMQC